MVFVLKKVGELPTYDGKHKNLLNFTCENEIYKQWFFSEYKKEKA